MLLSVSIRDVAAQAGVSLATVSKVLNDRTGTRISAITRQRVRTVATELGYSPNRLAQGMVQKRTQTLGVMVSGLQNPFFLSVLEELERQAILAGYQVFLDAAPSIDGTYATHIKLRGWPVDGVLMWAAANQDLAQFLGPQARDTPVVYLGYPRDDGSDWVAFDLEQGGRLATTYLIERGYRRIGYVYPWSWPRPDVSANHAACLQTCLENGISVETISTVRHEETRRAGLETGLEIAARPAAARPDAIFCHNDVIAVGVYHGLRRAGLRIPEDIALVGFDGNEEGQCLDVPLTTVHTPVDVFCEQAMCLLMQRLTGSGEGKLQQIIVPTRLLRGGTA